MTYPVEGGIHLKPKANEGHSALGSWRKRSQVASPFVVIGCTHDLVGVSLSTV